MPRPCYWTRKLEFDLVEFVRQKDHLWKPISNTNHHIQLKYQAYAEFAGRLGRGFTARSVRDRWVNIRSTFSYNLRKVEKSKATAASPADIYVPSWPLWRPLQFLREASTETKQGDDSNCENYTPLIREYSTNLPIKEETKSEFEDLQLNIRQQGQRTDRPRRKIKLISKPQKRTKCKKIIDDLIQSMKPLTEQVDKYKFFGKHVIERLNSMRTIDAEAASREIVKLLNDWSNSNSTLNYGFHRLPMILSTTSLKKTQVGIR